MQAKPTPGLSRPDLDSDRQAADLAMERYARGDDGAFHAVYAYMAPRLYRYLLRRCHDRVLSEDLLQQTFLRMHRSRASFEPGSRLAPWAFTIAGRVHIDGYRASGRDPQASGRGESEELCSSVSADETVHVRQLLDVVDRELGRLPEPQRSAFELVRNRGLSHADAASLLGVSVTAIKLRLHRARLALRAAVGADAIA